MNFASNAALQSHFPERAVVFMNSKKKKKVLYTLYKLLASYSIYFCVEYSDLCVYSIPKTALIAALMNWCPLVF